MAKKILLKFKEIVRQSYELYNNDKLEIVKP